MLPISHRTRAHRLVVPRCTSWASGDSEAAGPVDVTSWHFVISWFVPVCLQRRPSTFWFTFVTFANLTFRSLDRFGPVWTLFSDTPEWRLANYNIPVISHWYPIVPLWFYTVNTTFSQHRPDRGRCLRILKSSLRKERPRALSAQVGASGVMVKMIEIMEHRAKSWQKAYKSN
jgi:hypothetical protein